jgi:diguanylate cyclase
LCDIDHFKRFNDSWGHLVGDQVIRFIASVLRQHARGDFLAARYGGEEFAVIMPHTTLAQAETVGAEIQGSVRSKRLIRKMSGEALSPVTLSFGIAQLRVGDSVTDLVARADKCLYASKRAGRDRITTDSEPQTGLALAG